MKLNVPRVKDSPEHLSKTVPMSSGERRDLEEEHEEVMRRQRRDESKSIRVDGRGRRED